MTSEERKLNRRLRRECKRREWIEQFDNFEHLIDLNNLVKAYYISRKGVDWKESIQHYEKNLLFNIIDTKEDLVLNRPITRGFITFMLYDRGKARRIRSVRIKERVVRRAFCDHILAPIFTSSLIYHNKASVLGGGIHFHLREFNKQLRHFYRTNGFSNDGYILTVDFSKFFDRIPHNILFQMLNNKIQDKRIINVATELIDSFSEHDNHKSIGIGSHDSQIYGVSYPNRMDHFVKEQLKIKQYGRYMDDFYLIHKDKEYLKECLKEIKNIAGELGATINDKKTQIIKLSSWFTFLKWRYKLTETGKVVQKPYHKSVRRERIKLKKLKVMCLNNKIPPQAIESQYMSWRGYISFGNSRRAVKRMDRFYNSIMKECIEHERNNLEQQRSTNDPHGYVYRYKLNGQFISARKARRTYYCNRDKVRNRRDSCRLL